MAQAQAEHGTLSADEIARMIRRDDDDGFVVGAVDGVNLLEDGERRIRFGQRLADDDFLQLGEIDGARRGCAQQAQRAQTARRGSTQDDVACFGLFQIFG